MTIPRGRSLTLLAAAIVVVNGFFPAVWILLTSLKTEAELVSKPITWWPHNPTLYFCRQNHIRLPKSTSTILKTVAPMRWSRWLTANCFPGMVRVW